MQVLIAISSTFDIASKPTQVLANGSITVDQLKDLVKEAIKGQLESINQPSCTYAKPYSHRINIMKMPANYQPPKF